MKQIRVLTAAVLLATTFQAAAEIKPVNSIAAEVNSTIITYGEIQRAINELKSRASNKDIPEAQLAQAAKTRLMERALLADAARQMGLKVSQSQIDTELQRRANEAKSSVESLYKTAATHGYTREAYRLETAKDLLVERMFADMTDNIVITEAQLKQAADTVKANGQTLPQGQPYTIYTVRRLLLNAGNQQNMAAVGERMRQIAAAVQQGTPFETVVRRYSQEPQASTGGIHDNITEGMLPYAAETFLTQMQEGQITTPIASGTTWQMVQLISRRTESNPAKMQQEALRLALLNAERQKAQQQFIGQLQQNAVVREY